MLFLPSRDLQSKGEGKPINHYCSYKKQMTWVLSPRPRVAYMGLLQWSLNITKQRLFSPFLWNVAASEKMSHSSRSMVDNRQLPSTGGGGWGPRGERQGLCTLDASQSTKFPMSPIPARVGFHPVIGLIGNPSTPVLTPWCSPRPSSHPSFSLTPANPANRLPFQSPHKMLLFFELQALQGQEPSSCDTELTLKINVAVSRKKQRKRKKEREHLFLNTWV